LKTIVVLLFSVALIAADTLTYIHDGANRRTLDPQTLGFTDRTGLFAGTDPIPLAKLLPEAITDSTASITGTAHAGSELFDPLLNKYEKTNNVNSDHVSELSGIVTVPQVGMAIRGDYRYEDRFSQMFDRYSARYESTNNSALENSSFGLAEETGATATYRGKDVRGALTLNSYGRWGVVPGTDSIYHFRQGKTVRGIAELTHNRLTVRGGFGVDHFERPILPGDSSAKQYFNLENFTKTKNKLHKFDLATQIKLSKRMSIAFGAESNQNNDRRRIFYTSLAQESPRGEWQIRAIVVDNHFRTTYVDKPFGFGGELNGKLKFTQMLDLTGKLHAIKSDTAFSGEIVVYDTSYFRLTTLHSSSLNGSLSLGLKSVKKPITLKAILVADRIPSYEKFDSSRQFTMVQSYDNRSTAATGITGSWNLSRPLVQIALDGMIRADLLDKPSLSTPGFIRSAVTVGKLAPRSLIGRITLEERAPVTCVRFDGDATEQISRTGWSSSAHIDLEIPVVPPFLRNRIEPTMIMSAGPFYFSRNQQFEQLPGGNAVSPQIRIHLIGKLLVGTTHENRQ